MKAKELAKSFVPPALLQACRHLTGRTLLKHAWQGVYPSFRAVPANGEGFSGEWWLEHNRRHRITPRTIRKAVHDLEEFQYEAKREGLSIVRDIEAKPLSKKNLPHILRELERRMGEAADSLDFELATVLRDQLFELKGLSVRGVSSPSRRAKKRRKAR